MINFNGIGTCYTEIHENRVISSYNIKVSIRKRGQKLANRVPKKEP
jgi:hypothetical protein